MARSTNFEVWFQAAGAFPTAGSSLHGPQTLQGTAACPKPDFGSVLAEIQPWSEDVGYRFASKRARLTRIFRSTTLPGLDILQTHTIESFETAQETVSWSLVTEKHQGLDENIIKSKGTNKTRQIVAKFAFYFMRFRNLITFICVDWFGVTEGISVENSRDLDVFPKLWIMKLSPVIFRKIPSCEFGENSILKYY